ncbi:MAG: hypothetical protein EXQ94_13865 [Alphaproteobacteria bacterium]|nr:hypothetical protein [Alphaproteobacteria bacterium]
MGGLPDSISLDRALVNAPGFAGQDHHRPKPIQRLADSVLREGASRGVFGLTPLHDLDDPGDEGYTIYHRETVPAVR